MSWRVWMIGLGLAVAVATGFLLANLVGRADTPDPTASTAARGVAAPAQLMQKQEGRPKPPRPTRDLASDPVYVIDNADDIANQMEAEAFIIKPAQRACAGRWRLHDPEAEGSYTLNVTHVRYTLQPDEGPAFNGAIEPLDATTVEMIDDASTGDAGIEQHFLKCTGKKAVLSGSHIGDEVTLRRL